MWKKTNLSASSPKFRPRYASLTLHGVRRPRYNRPRWPLPSGYQPSAEEDTIEVCATRSFSKTIWSKQSSYRTTLAWYSCPETWLVLLQLSHWYGRNIPVSPEREARLGIPLSFVLTFIILHTFFYFTPFKENNSSFGVYGVPSQTIRKLPLSIQISNASRPVAACSPAPSTASTKPDAFSDLPYGLDMVTAGPVSVPYIYQTDTSQQKITSHKPSLHYCTLGYVAHLKSR